MLAPKAERKRRVPQVGDESLRRFLERVVLDDAFRDLVASEPDQAFEGFDLTDRHKEVLRRQDHELLALLGEALRDEPDAPIPGGPPEQMSESANAVPELKEAQLVVRLKPYAHHDEQGSIQLTYAASLHPWPAPQAEPGMLSFLLRVTPRAVLAKDGQLNISYAAMIQPAPEPGADLPPPGRAAAPSSSPNLPVDSPEALRAAEAVRAASPGDRYQRLLELIEAMRR